MLFELFEKYFTMPYLKWLTYALITFAWAGAFISGYDFETGIMKWGKVVHSTGELAWKLLLFTIFISLFYKLSYKIEILKNTKSFFQKLLPLRKYTGIFAFLIAFTHILAEVLKQGILFLPHDLFLFIWEDIGMLFGAIAFFAMLPAFITSTHWAIENMGIKFWKNVQRLTHGAFIFTALHIAFLRYHYTGEIDFGAFVPLFVYFTGYGYLFFEKLKEKQKK